ncbi:MAG: hypothetical protein IPP08_00455 [Chlorobiota bacterium]|nr:hypothetical protein [Chlorobiota bacterium]QQS66682.1 MAG: hypothetical protein IPP08_00455 [Chlorobiota bacterium]
MKRVVLILLVMVNIKALQSQINIIDSVKFTSDSPNTDLPISLPFGSGDKFTDGLDLKERETIIPGPPPQSFYVCFTDQHLETKAIGDRSINDFRGIPDNVKNFSIDTYKCTYEFEIFRYIGTKVIINFPNKILSKGIDSINFQDVQLSGKRVNKTIKDGNNIIEINEEGLKYIQMTVYYNLKSLRVKSINEEKVKEFKLVPNYFIKGNKIFLNLPNNVNTLKIYNSLGSKQLDLEIKDNHITIENLNSGKYYVILNGKNSYKSELIVE